jgi:hypothetical protein
LSILCLGLLGAFLWQLLQNPARERVQPTRVANQRNVAQQRLQDTINKTSTLVLSEAVFGKSIGISDTIHLTKDSVHINGNGMVLTSDSLYKGAGLMVGTDCKYVLLENMVFENFQKAIIAANNTVQLKNVQFTNCAVSLQHHYEFPANKYINGTLSDTTLFKMDSLPK